MRTLELFAGTASFSKVASKLGHSTFTVELDPRFKPTIAIDVMEWDERELTIPIDVLWASPPCQGFSVAVIGRNWNHDATPKTDSARLSMKLAQRTLDLIRHFKPRYWFIENPRGMLRKMPWMEAFLTEQGGSGALCLIANMETPGRSRPTSGPMPCRGLPSHCVSHVLHVTRHHRADRALALRDSRTTRSALVYLPHYFMRYSDRYENDRLIRPTM